MLNNYPVFNKCYTYDLENCNKLVEIKEEKIIESYHKLLSKLEILSQSIVCCRGTSKYSLDELGYKFIVGDKSNSHFSAQLNDMHTVTFEENRSKLINDIEPLRKKVIKSLIKRNYQMRIKEIKSVDFNDNDKIKEIEKNYLQSKIFIRSLYKKDLNLLDLYELFIFKIFLLRIEHTDGRNREFNSETPFLSLTYKSKKFTNARHFALSSDNKSGIIYVYSLFAGDPFYFKTSDLSKLLNLKGVLWHKDIYDELTLVGGMFPHHLLAIYEVEKYSTSKLIINPYLYENLKNNESFDCINGLHINQSNFDEYAKRLGYKTYFLNDKGKTTINCLLNNKEIGEIKNIR